MDELIERLFGDAKERDLIRLRAHLREQPALPGSSPAWLRLVQLGIFNAMPEQLDEQEMIDFAHLVDGYALAGLANSAVQEALRSPRVDLTSPTLLPSQIWAAMFMEHRRLRFENRNPSGDDHRWLSAACSRLRAALAF